MYSRFNKTSFTLVVLLLIVALTGCNLSSNTHRKDVPLTGAPELIGRVEPVPPQFAHFTDRDWQALWEAEVKEPTSRERTALMAYIPETEYNIWEANYLQKAQALMNTDKLGPSFPIDKVVKAEDWQVSPSNTPHVRYQLMRFHGLVFVGWLTASYNQSQDRRYLDKAKTLALSWVRACKRGESTTPEMAWHDHTSALRLLVLSYLWETLRLAKYPLQANDVRDLALSIHDHMDLMHQPGFYRAGHNHGFFQSRAVLLSAKLTHFSQRVPQWYKEGLKGTMKYLEESVTEEGIHKEHSANYHLEMIYQYKRSLVLLQLLKEAPFLQLKIHKRLVAMENFSKYFLDASGNIIPYGDTPCCKLPPLAPYPEKKTKIFPITGFAAFRNTWKPKEKAVHLFFTNSYFGRAHKHADNLGFHLSAFGHPWLVDAGHSGYERNAFREHALSSFAHNTAVVDESSMLIKRLVKDNAVGTAPVDGPGWVGVKGFHRLYPGVVHTRTIQYDEDKAFVIADTLEPDETYRPKPGEAVKTGHTFDLLFHFPPAVRLARHPWGVVATQPNVPWELVLRPASEQPFDTLDIISGQTKPYLLGWYYPVYGKATPLNTVRFRYTGKALPLVTTSMYFRQRGSTDDNPLWPNKAKG